MGPPEEAQWQRYIHKPCESFRAVSVRVWSLALQELDWSTAIPQAKDMELPRRKLTMSHSVEHESDIQCSHSALCMLEHESMRLQ